jgi:hypothetical protein
MQVVVYLPATQLASLQLLGFGDAFINTGALQVVPIEPCLPGL